MHLHVCVHLYMWKYICASILGFIHTFVCMCTRVWEFVCTSECLWAHTHSHTIPVAWSLSGDMALGGPASWNPETWKTNQRLKLILH